MQSEPKTFRKRPVVIEAVQWTGKNVLAVYSFMHGAPTIKHDIARDKWYDFEGSHLDKDWHIKTLEDGPNAEAKHVASVGDWIIKGVEGEFYPCKPSVFAATYEDAVSVSPSPISADAVVEAIITRFEDLVLSSSHSEFRGLSDHAAFEAGQDNASAQFIEAIRALKGTFPAAPEAKSEVAVKAHSFLPTEDGEYNGNDHGSGNTPLIERMANVLDDLPPDETIGFNNGVQWVEVATVQEIREAAYPAIRSALVDPEGGL